jgi:hypothetical protein
MHHLYPRGITASGGIGCYFDGYDRKYTKVFNGYIIKI